jgi:DnaJ-class molecular chaperone
MKCLRCNGSGKERKRPNLPAQPCYWCQGTGQEPQ